MTNGWYNKSVKAEFSCSDVDSGIATDSVSGNFKAFNDGANQFYSSTEFGECVDRAGNVADSKEGIVNIDTTPPSVPSVSGVTEGESYITAPTPVCADLEDVTSGIDQEASKVVISENADGSFTAICTAIDKAGNETPSVPVNYSIQADVFSPGTLNKNDAPIIDTTTPTFKWPAIDNALEYQLQVRCHRSATSTKWNRLLSKKSISDNQYTLNSGEALPSDRLCKFRARARVSGSWQSYSADYFFQVP